MVQIEFLVDFDGLFEGFGDEVFGPLVALLKLVAEVEVNGFEAELFYFIVGVGLADIAGEHVDVVGVGVDLVVLHIGLY